MKKRNLIACVLTSLLLPISAQAEWKNNWLLGISGGYSSHETDFDNTFVLLPPGIAPFSFSTNYDFDANPWLLGLLGGYQMRCNRWLMGAELSFDWENNVKQNYAYGEMAFLPDTAYSGSATYKRETTIGLTARIGYEATCWLMPYLRLGVETSRDKLEVDMRSFSNANADPHTYSASTENRSYRFVGGVGLELPMIQCTGLSARAEYNYISSSRDLNVNSLWSDPQFQSIFNFHNNHTNVIKASLVYNFSL
jgi:opacity protein-like surface antigen